MNGSQYDVTPDGSLVAWTAQHDLLDGPTQFELVLTAGDGSWHEPLGIPVPKGEQYSDRQLKKLKFGPDGKRLAFFGRGELIDDECVNRVQILDVASRELTEIGQVKSPPVWKWAGGAYDHLVCTYEWLEKGQLDISWSPDGQIIAYASDRSEIWSIHLTDLEGLFQRNVTAGEVEIPGYQNRVRWQPR